MTAILGFNYLGGALMMADSEETTSYETKSEGDKLYRFIFPIGTVITGGSGDAHLIDCANQELHTFFAQGGCQTPDKISSPQEILDGLNRFAGRFFRKTIGQYSVFDADERPNLEMLIAVNYNKRTDLFRWGHNRVRWIGPPHHVAIGLGEAQLHPMLRDFQYQANKEATLFMGLRMMYHAKRTVLGVGGRTEAIALQHNGTTHYFGTDDTKKAEELVVNFEQFINKFVYPLVSDISTEAPELEENVAKALADIPDNLRKYREAYREILRAQLNPPALEEDASSNQLQSVGSPPASSEASSTRPADEAVRS